MNIPPSAVAFIALAVAGLIVLMAWMRGQAARSAGARTMLRSIPEAVTRAKRAQNHVVVFFLDPADPVTQEIVDLAFDPDLSRLFLRFERVRVDASKDDLDVAKHVASKYGMTELEPPSVLVLDRDGRKLDFVLAKALGAGTPELREKLVGFLERARARF